MEALKFGFIGAGFIARFMARAMTQVRGVDAAGVVSLKRAKDFSEYAQSLGLGPCPVYGSIRELCDACDAVGVFVPNFARLETVRAIAEAVKGGAQLKGVACEKPLGRTVAEAKELCGLAEDAGFATAYFENQLHMKPIKAQLAQLAPQQAAMGPMSLVRCAEEHAGPHEGWFWDPIQQGGGTLLDMGCHSISCGWYCLTPPGKPLTYLEPIEVICDIGLLKWGQPHFVKELKKRMGVDYRKTPAEDFATGTVTFLNPETGAISKTQFTNSWMYDKQGLRVFVDGIGPGYAFEFNSLRAPLEVFIGDEAADAAADAESALEKATASRGLLAVQSNEPDLYGYVDELAEMRDAFLAGRNGLADWKYGLEITRLCMAAYLAAEQKQAVDLTSSEVKDTLESFVPKVAQGRGTEMLHVG